uniref:Biliverdin reductase A n=1 Tax=Jaculus jaculus TaxID=51337 RepID=A0A8C5NXY8_JACJA
PGRKFGVVVVGVGRAGSVRIRDLQSPHPSSAFLNLIGFVSRRTLGSRDEVPQISLEDALSSPEVHVAYICSESSSHEDYIKVLHEEHVELLMEEFAFLQKEVVGKELLKGSLHFTAGPLEEEQFGFPAFSGISRLTWLVCLFGELSLASATLEERKEDQYMKMTVQLETKNKCPLSWIEEKGPGLKRNRYLSFHFKSGSLDSVPNVAVNKNIFLKDQELFVQKLLGQVSEKDLAAERRRILHCLGLAEGIRQLCRP